MADTPELAAAYRALEATIADIGRLEGADGVLTEWVVVTSRQRYHDDGTGITQIATILPYAGHVPHHRVMGLLDCALTLCRAEVAAP